MLPNPGLLTILESSKMSTTNCSIATLSTLLSMHHHRMRKAIHDYIISN